MHLFINPTVSNFLMSHFNFTFALYLGFKELYWIHHPSCSRLICKKNPPRYLCLLRTFGLLQINPPPPPAQSGWLSTNCSSLKTLRSDLPTLIISTPFGRQTMQNSAALQHSRLLLHLPVTHFDLRRLFYSPKVCQPSAWSEFGCFKPINLPNAK